MLNIINENNGVDKSVVFEINMRRMQRDVS